MPHSAEITKATCPSSVRIVTAGDENAVYDLLMLLYAENAMASLSETKVREMIRRATEKRGGLIGVIDGKDGIEASVGLILSTWWYSDAAHLEEMWTFVHPDHRKSNHARDLIEFSKWAAETMGIPLLMGILTTHKADAKVRLYRSMIPQAGALFVHRVGGTA